MNRADSGTTSRSSSRLRKLVFAAVTLMSTVVFCEFAFRIAVSPPWGHRKFDDRLMMNHKVRHYTLAPDQTHQWKARDWDIEVRVNKRGLRDSSFDDARFADFRVLAVGDSLTFGLGIEHEETWTQRLEKRIGLQLGNSMRATVVNAGVPGYSAQQMRQMAEELQRELEPHVVIFAMFATTHYRVPNPFVLHGGHLITAGDVPWVELTARGDLIHTGFRPGPVRKIDTWLKTNFHMGAHLLTLAERARQLVGTRQSTRLDAVDDVESIRRNYQPVLDEIKETWRLAKEGGATLIVLAINSQEKDGSFAPRQRVCNDILRDFCATNGISFVDPLPSLVSSSAGRPIFRFAHDMHWNGAANEVAAEQLFVLFEREGLLPQPPEP